MSLFFVEIRDEKGLLKNIRINRLKDKLGTKALPTAELTLTDTPAILIGKVGEGVKTVSALLNITRLYNSVTALGAMQRGLQLAKSFAQKRSAFGRTLAEHPLHVRTLAKLQVEFEGCFVFVFHLLHLLGKDECGTASATERAVLRLLTPIAKLWSAKLAQTLSSEVLESFGGAGYIEDSGVPKLLRDSQVFSIWEGTTNVLSLDVLRAITKEKGLSAYLADMRARLSHLTSSELKEPAAIAAKALSALENYLNEISVLSPELMPLALEAGARDFALSIARTTAAILLMEFAVVPEAHGQAIEVAKEFCRAPLTVLEGVNTLLNTDFSELLF